MGPKDPRGVWFGFLGLPGQRASDFFVLPDYPNPAKRLAGAASAGEDGGCAGGSDLKNLHGGCPVLGTHGNLKGGIQAYRLVALRKNLREENHERYSDDECHV